MVLDDILEEGTLYSFYGVHDCEFKLGNIVFEALDDPCDGYRSYLDSVPIVNSKSIFSPLPIINLYFKRDSQMLSEQFGYDMPGDFYIFYDKTGHIWLYFGTDHCDDYYPMFTFHYSPRLDVESYSTPIDNLKSLDPLFKHAEKLI